jgi:hypothetical protein
MDKGNLLKVVRQGVSTSSNPASSSCRSLKFQQCAKIAELRQVLRNAGFQSLNSQARVLGLGRSTTWAILSAGHKSSGLRASIIIRMLRSSELPPAARRVIEEYVAQKLAGTFGHGEKQLKRFREQLELDVASSAVSSPMHRVQIDLSVATQEKPVDNG